MDNPRPEKVAVVDEVRGRLSSASAALLTEYRGLNVKDLANLRTAVRDAGGEYRIYKNTLVRLAARELGLDELQRAKPAAAKGRYMRGVTVSSTMGPGVKVDPNPLRALDEELSGAAAVG